MTLDEQLRGIVREELDAQLGPIRERLERPRGALRPEEAAEYLGVSETTLRGLDLEYVPIGQRGRRYAIAVLDRWLADHSQRDSDVA